MAAVLFVLFALWIICSACFATCCCAGCMTAGQDTTSNAVALGVVSRRRLCLAFPHPSAHGLLSLISFLRAFSTKLNQAQSSRARRALSRRAPHDSQDAMVLLTFPGRSFPAGAVSGWPESPDADEHEHSKFSMHMRFGVPTQPSAMDPRQVNRRAHLAAHPCNTRVSCFHFGHRTKPRPSHQNGYITSRRCYLGTWDPCATPVTWGSTPSVMA